ncbi:MAG: major capsid protein [bacterium]
MTENIYDYRALTTAINAIEPIPSLFLDVVFKVKNQNFATNLDIDVETNGVAKRLAPFVAPMQGGKIVKALGYTTKTVKFPRIRVKKQLSAKDILGMREVGNSIYVGESATIDAMKNSKIAREQSHLKNLITRRVEWMAAQALKGKIAYTSDDLAFEIDFGMQETHKPTLDGNNVWGGTSSNIVANIRTYKNLILQATNLTADTALIGTSALDKLLADEKVQKLLDNRNMAAGSIDLQAKNYVGRLLGVDIYECAEQYLDEEGVSHSMIDEEAFVLFSSAAKFTQEFGLIEDLDAQVGLEFFSKMWNEKDPSSAWLLAESNPLPVVYQPDAVVYATVV